MVVGRGFAVAVRRAALAAGVVGACAVLGVTATPAVADSADLGRLESVELLNGAWSFDKAAVSLGLTYMTTDQRGNAARATAGLYLPAGLPPAGGWPLVVWAHGTIGIGNDCAPSHRPQSDRNRSYFNQILDSGYAVLAPDYQGLGTGGNFSYYNTEVESRSILDAVTAVRALPVQLSQHWVLIGQSEGAHAVMSAAALYAQNPRYAAGLTGVIATGLRTNPPKSLREMFRASSTGSDNQVGYAGYYLAALEELHPGSVTPYLSEFGRQYVEKAATECLSDLVADAQGRRPAALVADPDNPTPTFESDIKSLVGYQENLVPADVMIGYGTADIDVPPADTPAYGPTLQAHNPWVHVTVTAYPGKDHSGAFLASLPDALDFLHTHLP
ncbi:lipase family protein [Nocardia sp. CDC153]|uniref:alpha/beta hydrolase family protein n=1 Tax=Nocardia sp. CDC153 TaxID=3112167 RepID=UPI002DB72095|nr:lipase family protein [Nocardia sp. CDC153]MEC3952663.1 lipase family protein [Nocardia sp. CDC153]